MPQFAPKTIRRFHYCWMDLRMSEIRLAHKFGFSAVQVRYLKKKLLHSPKSALFSHASFFIPLFGKNPFSTGRDIKTLNRRKPSAAPKSKPVLFDMRGLNNKIKQKDKSVQLAMLKELRHIQRLLRK